MEPITTICDNCQAEVDLEDTHDCPECGNILCGYCICESCENKQREHDTI